MEARARRHAGPAEPVLAVPRPLEAPRQGLTFSPVVVVAALLTVLHRRVRGLPRRPARPVRQAADARRDRRPSTAVVEVDEDATQYTLAGTSDARARRSRSRRPAASSRTGSSADAAGRWTADVTLRRGRNEFAISALDPETGKPSEDTAKVFITVPFLVLEAPTLTVESAGGGREVRERRDPGQGHHDERENVAVSRRLHGPRRGPARLGRARRAGKGAKVGPKTVTVDARTARSRRRSSLSTGKWQVTVTATSAEGKTTTLTRESRSATRASTSCVEIKNGRAWLKVWVDGKVSKVTGTAGKVSARARC